MSRLPPSLKFAALLSIAFGLYLLGNRRVPLWDRDEPRYAECSREMLRSGDWVVPHFLGHYRYDKPPFIYWCELTAMSLFGENSASARLPSAVSITLVAVLLWLFLRRYAGAAVAGWTVFIFCTAGLVIATAKMSIIDPTLLVFLMTVQGCLFVLWRRANVGDAPLLEWSAAPGEAAADAAPAEAARAAGGVVDYATPADPSGPRRPRTPFVGVPLLLWAAIGVGFLTKGPVILAHPLLTMIVLAALGVGRRLRSWPAWRHELRWWRDARPLIGLPVAVAIVAPWGLMLMHRAPGFAGTLAMEAARHTGADVDGHAKPPGTHTLLLCATFMPWTLLLPTGIGLGIRHRREPLVRFALAAALGPWLVIEVMRVKLPHYALPSFGPLAFLTAVGLLRCLRGQHDDLTRRAGAGPLRGLPVFKAASVVWVLAILGIGAALWLMGPKFGELPRGGMAAFTAAATAFAALVALLIYRDQFRRAAMAMGAMMVVCIGIAFAFLFPNFGFLHLSTRLADDLAKQGATGPDQPVAMIDYKEPSLGFYQGGGARERDDGYLESTPPAQWPTCVVLSQPSYDRLPPWVKDAFGPPVAREHGLMYAGSGRFGDVLVLRKPPGPIAPPAGARG